MPSRNSGGNAATDDDTDLALTDVGETKAFAEDDSNATAVAERNIQPIIVKRMI